MKTLIERIGLALERMNKGSAPIRIPADMGDVDIVLDDCRKEIERLEKLAYLGDHHHEDSTYKARLEELTRSHRETVSGQCAPDELHCSCVPALRAEIARLPLKSYEHAHGNHVEKVDPESRRCGEYLPTRTARSTGAASQAAHS